MKHILSIFLILTSTDAFASKARLKSLNNSFHITDTQSEFTSPYHMFGLKDFISFESGSTVATGADDGAEALAKFSLNETSKLLVALGHKDEAVQNQRKFINAVAGTTFHPQQNPVELIYAAKTESMTWGLGVFYSQFKDKLVSNKESSTGLRLGASHGDFKWKANLGLVNKVENVTDGVLTAQPYVNVALRYNVDVNKFALDYTTWEAKRSNVAGTEVDSHSYQNIKFQYVQTFAKDGEDFFYGIGIDSISLKNKLNDKKLSRLALPIWIGLENQSSDWLTLRASIKQVLFAQSKDENGYAAGSIDGAFGVADSEYGAEPNTTEVAMGAGLKFQQVVLDGTLKALSGKVQTQQINGTNLFALVGMTYSFN